MQFTSIVTLALTAAFATAMPATSPNPVVRTGVMARQINELCPGDKTPLCCQTDALGVADLSCETPSWDPKYIKDFENNCAATGKTAECCTVSLDGIALLCTQV